MNKLISSYPYPVLRPYSTDYVNESFYADCQPSLVSGKRYRFSFTMHNSCEELNRMILAGEAVYLIRFICKTTMYRVSFTFTGNEYIAEIPRTDLLNEVLIETMIISLTDSDSFYSPSFNPDYEGLDISIKAGDPLAIGKTIRFDAMPQNEIGATPDSIIRFQKDSSPNAPPVSVVTQQDYIYIKLRPEEIRRVAVLLTPAVRWIGEDSLIWSVFVIPALTEVLSKWFSVARLGEAEQEEAKGYRWFRVIREKFAELHVLTIGDDGNIVDDNDYELISQYPFRYAEMLIDNPLAKSALAMELIAFPDIEKEELEDPNDD